MEPINPDYIFSNDFYKSIDVMVCNCGFENCKPSHSYGPAVRSSYMIHYILSGKGIFKVHDRTYHLKAGDAFFIRPGELIYYEADAADPWSYTWIGMQGVKIPEYIARTTLNNHPILHFNPDTTLAKLMHTMTEIPVTPESDLAFNSVLYAYLYELTTMFPLQVRKKHTKPSDAYLQEILSFIEGNIDKPYTIQDLSREIGLDRSYLHRIFKEKMGMSIKDYQSSIRISNACSLLLATDLTISEVARSCGYEDVLYFSRFFKKMKHCTPTEYRTSRREELEKSGRKK